MPPAPDAPCSAAAALVPFLDDGGKRRHWQDEFDRLAAGERDALSGLLLTIALVRRVEANDFAAVAKLLEIALAFGLANAPATSQAAELLDRLVVFSTRTEPTTTKPADCQGSSPLQTPGSPPRAQSAFT
jgi:hypothetical protein